MLRAKGNLHDAIREYTEVIRLRPTYPWSHYHLAECFEELGRPREALPYLHKALLYFEELVDSGLDWAPCMVDKCKRQIEKRSEANAQA